MGQRPEPWLSGHDQDLTSPPHLSGPPCHFVAREARTRNLEMREKNARKPTSRFRVHRGAMPRNDVAEIDAEVRAALVELGADKHPMSPPY
jgi:hypothetical protein